MATDPEILLHEKAVLTGTINDPGVKMLFEKIRLTLDTGVDKNAMDREENAQMVLQAVGAPALPWVAEQMGWTNRAQLVADLEKYDEGKQLTKEMDKISKQSGLGKDQIMELLMQAVQAQMAAGKEGQGQGGPAPAGPPPMPPGGPGSPMMTPGGLGGPAPVPPGMESMAMAGMGVR